MKVYKPSGIPDNFNYIDISSDYIDFYNSSNPLRDTTYYRVYYNYPDLFEVFNTSWSGNYNLQLVETTSDFVYRPDFPQILYCSITFIIIFIFIFNIITSIIRKGGLLRGLL